MSLISRADYPGLTKAVVLAEMVKLANALQDQLLMWCKATRRQPCECTFVSEVNGDGVEVFWVHPAVQLEGRPAVAWSLSESGARCSTGILGKLPQ